jgi:hypothetical protein
MLRRLNRQDGIDAANVASLSRRHAVLGGTADASAIYLRE